MTFFSQTKHVASLGSSRLDNQSILHIAYGVDKNYLKPCGICIYSILVNNPHLNFAFYIVTDYFDTNGFEQLVGQFSNVCIEIYEIQSTFFRSLQSNSRFTTAMYFRLAVPELVKGKVDQILYLDADIICDGKLDELLKIHLEQETIAAVNDKGCSLNEALALGLSNQKLYFNSGVMLIQVKNWLQRDTFNKFANVIQSRKFNYPDQDALNIVLKDHIIYLPSKFNDIHHNEENAIFVHFISSPKPWTLAGDYNPRYMKYYLSSPWCDEPRDLPKNYRDTKKLSKKLFDQSHFILSFKWFMVYLYRRAFK